MSVESAGIAGRGNNEREQAEKAEWSVLPAKIGSWRDPKAAIKQFHTYTPSSLPPVSADFLFHVAQPCRRPKGGG